jgi:hypothetical protein
VNIDKGQLEILEQVYSGEQLRQALAFWDRVPEKLKARIPEGKIADYIIKNEYLWLDRNQQEGGDDR